MKLGSLVGLALSAGLFVGCSGLPLGSSLSTPPRVSDVRIVQEGGKTGVAYTWADPAGYSPEGSYTAVDWGDDGTPDEVRKGTGRAMKRYLPGSPEFAQIAPLFPHLQERAWRDCGFYPEDAYHRWYQDAVTRRVLGK